MNNNRSGGLIWPDPSVFLLNPDAPIHFQEISEGQNCAIVDNALLNPTGLIDFAIQNANHFAMKGVPPGPRLILHERFLENLRRLLRSRMSKYFPMYRSGIQLSGCLSNITVPPENLSHLQRLCHADRLAGPGRKTYAGLIYLFQDPNLGGTGFYRWKKPELMEEAERLHKDSSAAAIQYLENASEIFSQPPAYMTTSTDIAELLTVVPARFNRLVFYDGEAPHSGHISHPELLSDDLSKGRLTLNFFANVVVQ